MAEINPDQISEKSWLVTFIISIFAGTFGIHSFYVGKTVPGIIQLLTCGGCGIWTIYDIIMIALKKYTDAEGKIICK